MTDSSDKVAKLISVDTPEALAAARDLRDQVKAGYKAHTALHERQQKEMQEAVEAAGLNELRERHRVEHDEFMEAERLARHEAFVKVGEAVGVPVEMESDLTPDTEYLETLGIAVLKSGEGDDAEDGDNPLAALMRSMAASNELQ